MPVRMSATSWLLQCKQRLSPPVSLVFHLWRNILKDTERCSCWQPTTFYNWILSKLSNHKKGQEIESTHKYKNMTIWYTPHICTLLKGSFFNYHLFRFNLYAHSHCSTFRSKQTSLHLTDGIFKRLVLTKYPNGIISPFGNMIMVAICTGNGLYRIGTGSYLHKWRP